ncbi:c-type cytochrome [Granulosicoccus sp. 3-233]|uniref:c-type cytochrome n=1 Tax=Granulosicoccus sp. 3-233 TaxID=3417969 RepID=UPI003D326780
MMNKKLALATACTCCVLIASSTFSLAEDGPYDNAIKARQGMFQLYSFNVGILSDMAKEKIPYDADIASEAANNLSAAANLGQSQFWPAGSDNETDGNMATRAKPEIWETYPAITEKAAALSDAVAALVPVAGSGLGELQGAIGDVGASCKGCHDDFRAKSK